MSVTINAKKSKLQVLQVRELKNGFGVEVKGLDFIDGVSDESFHIVQELLIKVSSSKFPLVQLAKSLLQYGVAVLRKTNLDDKSHIELARKFGELDDVKPYNKAGRKNRLDHDELFDVGNIEADNTLVAPNSPRAQANKGNSFFHVDSSFNPRRAGYSLLLAHELPPPNTGGATEFCDTRAAWDDLPEDLKRDLLLKDYIACHSILHSKKLAAPDYFANVEPIDFPMGRHRLVQPHERSGRTNLYLAMHIHHIEGLTAAKSQALFDMLFKHATEERYKLCIEWHDIGDLVIWDNTCTMHRAVGGAFAYKYRRDMRRATVHDDSSQAWGLNEKTDVRQGLP
jgi:alpha-ketoglutarate-dependent 2,4-dichlorophenoxyacetate dioxygenase